MKYKAVKIVGSFLKGGWGATKSWAARVSGPSGRKKAHRESWRALRSAVRNAIKSMQTM